MLLSMQQQLQQQQQQNGIRLCWVGLYLILPTYLILQFSCWSGQANSIATWTARHGLFCLFYFYCLFSVFFFSFFFFFLSFFFPLLKETKSRRKTVLRHTLQDLSFSTLYKTCPSADYFTRLVLTVADWNQGRCVSSKSDGPALSCWGFGEIPSDFRRP